MFSSVSVNSCIQSLLTSNVGPMRSSAGLRAVFFIIWSRKILSFSYHFSERDNADKFV